MAPARVVPTFNPSKNGQAGLGLCLPGPSGNQRTLQAGKEAFCHGVVVGIAHCPHGRAYTHFFTPISKRNEGLDQGPVEVGLIHL
jgi:hypothetical protein